MCASGRRRATFDLDEGLADRLDGDDRSQSRARRSRAAFAAVSLEDMPETFEPAAEEIDPLAARDRSEAPGGADALPCAARRGKAPDRSARLLPRREPRGARQAIRAAGADDQDLAASQSCAAQGLPVVMSLSPGRRSQGGRIRARHAGRRRARGAGGAPAARAGTRRGDRRLGEAARAAERSGADRRRRRAISSPGYRGANRRGSGRAPARPPRSPI